MRILITNHHDFFEVTPVLPNVDLEIAMKNFIAKELFNGITNDRIIFSINSDGRLYEASVRGWGATQRGAGYEDVPCTIKLNTKHIASAICEKLKISMGRPNLYFADDRTSIIITEMQTAPKRVALPTHTIEL